MTRRPVASTRQQRQYAHDLADEIDATVLHNLVHDEVGEDDQLARLCDAEAAAETAAESRERDQGRDGPLVDDVCHAADQVGQVAHQRALEVVAETCATVLDEGDDWIGDPYAAVEVATAQAAAGEWLEAHPDAAGRAGVVDVLADEQSGTEVEA